MPGKTNRRFLVSPADSSNHAGARLGELVIFHLEARCLQQLAQKLRAIPLHAGRVDGVVVQQVAGELKRLNTHGLLALNVQFSFFASSG